MAASHKSLFAYFAALRDSGCVSTSFYDTEPRSRDGRPEDTRPPLRSLCDLCTAEGTESCFPAKISLPRNGTATTKTRRTTSYTKGIILDFFVHFCALRGLVVVVAVRLGCGPFPRCVKRARPLFHDGRLPLKAPIHPGLCRGPVFGAAGLRRWCILRSIQSVTSMGPNRRSLRRLGGARHVR